MNILLITTDQQRWDHLGLAGLAGIETPNLDRLGREGRLFNRAYCPSRRAGFRRSPDAIPPGTAHGRSG